MEAICSQSFASHFSGKRACLFSYIHRLINLKSCYHWPLFLVFRFIKCLNNPSLWVQRCYMAIKSNNVVIMRLTPPKVTGLILVENIRIVFASCRSHVECCDVCFGSRPEWCWFIDKRSEKSQELKRSQTNKFRIRFMSTWGFSFDICLLYSYRCISTFAFRFEN